MSTPTSNGATTYNKICCLGVNINLQYKIPRARCCHVKYLHTRPLVQQCHDFFTRPPDTQQRSWRKRIVYVTIHYRYRPTKSITIWSLHTSKRLFQNWLTTSLKKQQHLFICFSPLEARKGSNKNSSKSSNQTIKQASKQPASLPAGQPANE